MSRVIRYRFDGAAITKRRKRACLSQIELAKWSGADQKYISRVEGSHHVPSVVKLANLAAAIGCKPGDLFTECLIREEIEIEP